MKLNSCQLCGRQLKDADSIARGFGPECAAKRASFLASCGTSDEELSTIQHHESPAVSRWANNFRQDMRAGRIRQARQCIEAGRYQMERFGASMVAHVFTGDEPADTVAAVGVDAVATPFIEIEAARRQAGQVRAAAQSGTSNDQTRPSETALSTFAGNRTVDTRPAVAVTTVGAPRTVAVNTVQSVSAVGRNTADASEPPEPAIVVRESERGFRVHPPYQNPPFISAFKKTVGGRWYPESAEWFIPAEQLEWVKELLEYWFRQPVYIARSSALS